MLSRQALETDNQGFGFLYGGRKVAASFETIFDWLYTALAWLKFLKPSRRATGPDAAEWQVFLGDMHDDVVDGHAT
jgi:hypothetical protein